MDANETAAAVVREATQQRATLKPIDLRIDLKIRDPEYRRGYYDAQEEEQIAEWRWRLGWIGRALNALTGGWWSASVLRCPRPTAGEIDAAIQAAIAADAATRAQQPTLSSTERGDTTGTADSE